MYLYIVDEASVNWDKKIGFFMCGGIIVDMDSAKSLTNSLGEIKDKYSLPQERPIKWTNNAWKAGGEGPLDPEIFKSLKRDILSAFKKSGAKIIVVTSPQSFFHEFKVDDEGSIVLNKDNEPIMKIVQEKIVRSHTYGMNDSMNLFNTFLEENDSRGMIICDTFPDVAKRELEEMCECVFPCSGPKERISFPTMQIANEKSPLHQVNDVVLGSIHWSLREMTENFLPEIRDCFWMETPGDYESILTKGFAIRPRIARYPSVQRLTRGVREKFIRRVNAV